MIRRSLAGKTPDFDFGDRSFEPSRLSHFLRSEAKRCGAGLQNRMQRVQFPLDLPKYRRRHRPNAVEARLLILLHAGGDVFVVALRHFEIAREVDDLYACGLALQRHRHT